HGGRRRVLVQGMGGADRDREWDFDASAGVRRPHDPALPDKPTLVAFNKIDLPSAAEAWPAFRKARANDGMPVVAIAAATGEGIGRFRAALAELLPPAEELGAAPEPAGVVVHRIDAAPDRVSVSRDAD